jgi:hypothetical protein
LVATLVVEVLALGNRAADPVLLVGVLRGDAGLARLIARGVAAHTVAAEA